MADTSLTLSVETGATPAQVWRCLTEPELLKQWFAPAPVTVTDAEIDPTPGGGFRTVMQVPEMGEMDGGWGCVLVADPERRIVWTSALGPGFKPNPAPGEGAFAFTADIRLAETAEGCTYTATVLHASDADRAAHEAMGFHDGWGAAAQQLADLARTL